MNLIEQKVNDEDDLAEKEAYLDESIDKVEEDLNESNENFDINPDHNDFGESSR